MQQPVVNQTFLKLSASVYTPHNLSSKSSLLCFLQKRTKIVPDVHLSAERADLDDGLAQEIIRLAFEMLLHPRLDVVVLVPHAHLDAVGGVVAFAALCTREAKKVGSEPRGDREIASGGS